MAGCVVPQVASSVRPLHSTAVLPDAVASLGLRVRWHSCMCALCLPAGPQSIDDRCTAQPLSFCHWRQSVQAFTSTGAVGLQGNSVSRAVLDGRYIMVAVFEGLGGNGGQEAAQFCATHIFEVRLPSSSSSWLRLLAYAFSLNKASCMLLMMAAGVCAAAAPATNPKHC